MRTLHLVHLYPDLLTLDGDRGNIITLCRRCAWRGITLTVTTASLGETVDFTAADLVFIGGSADREQPLVYADLEKTKGPALAAAVEERLPVLAVGAGYQLLGRCYRFPDRKELPGLGVFAAWTEPGEKRLTGNVVATAPMLGEKSSLVGFENHQGRTFLAEPSKTRPLAQVITGHGNNGRDGTEGAIYRNAIGTYLQGPLLPKNPALADWLLARALKRRYQDGSLAPLPDKWETLAHQSVVKRFG
ncbi:MAG: glutamine amidotransferase [Heliobacteriaceae bacterium]|nr:glutamine amidotransferase [Heliobacteriaceae bacterium]MDD4587656.1 glutamine amidotransferase [Heliobacteriaceae bacterium]